jgi:hypothetical protein
VEDKSTVQEAVDEENSGAAQEAAVEDNPDAAQQAVDENSSDAAQQAVVECSNEMTQGPYQVPVVGKQATKKHLSTVERRSSVIEKIPGNVGESDRKERTESTPL